MLSLFEGFEIHNPCFPKEKEKFKWDVYAKNIYSPKVKVTNWWYHREGFPKDCDDLTHSSYNRLGNMKEDPSWWITETRDAMEQGRGNAELNALKRQVKPPRILNFWSYPHTVKPRKDLLPEEIRKILPTLPKEELAIRYTTTHKSHFKKIPLCPS